MFFFIYLAKSETWKSWSDEERRSKLWMIITSNNKAECWMKIENIFYFSIFFLLLFRTIFVQLFGILYLAFDFKIYFIFDFIFFMLTFLMVRFWTGTWIMAHWQNVLQILSVALFNPDIFCRRLLFSIDGFIFSSMIFCCLFILYFFRVSWWTFFFLSFCALSECIDVSIIRHIIGTITQIFDIRN